MTISIFSSCGIFSDEKPLYQRLRKIITKMPQQSASTYNHDSYFILSPNFKPKPSGQRRSVPAISHNPNSDQDSQSVCGLIAAQNEHTEACTLKTAEDPTETINYPVYRPTFPPIPLDEPGYLQLEPMERLPFAQYPVSHFTQPDWDIIWERPAIDLDPYLITMEYDNRPTSLPTVFHPEREFAGYSYRVELDASRLEKKIFFRRGTAVDIREINEPDGRYLVEYCQLIRDGIAYLPVHFREYHNQGFSTANDPRHHSFILAVPAFLCKSPFLPHLHPHIANYNTVHIIPPNNPSTLREDEPSLGWRQRFNYFSLLFC